MTITPEARQAAAAIHPEYSNEWLSEALSNPYNSPINKATYRNLHSIADGVRNSIAAIVQRSLDAQAEKYRPIVEALESISEYWNLDANHEAMLDACHHNAETAQEALALARELGMEEKS